MKSNNNTNSINNTANPTDIMQNQLTAISPIDGRYRKQTEPLSAFFSEHALVKYRVLVEIEYFTALCSIPLPQLEGVKKQKLQALKKVFTNFSLKDSQRVKELESITNHDVKAVEYFLKEKFDEIGLSKYKEFVHFALTSQDINNTAIPLSLKEAMEQVYKPLIEEVTSALNSKAKEWSNIVMLARTHGQPASPTRLGKEIKVFTQRIEGQLKLLKTIPYSSKFGGATGNFNAHFAAYPNINWHAWATKFQKEAFGLQRTSPTTQIEPYDNLAALLDNLKRINTILLDFSRDAWLYISMEYFGQKVKKDEVGSSAMPHKINPIDFENAEGNLGIANALFTHLSGKLPISRLQRDLTDSTVLRNLGVSFAHTVIALNSLKKGIGKLIVNKSVIAEDLEKHPEVVTEGIQTILRREGYTAPYEELKRLTRTGSKITRERIAEYVKNLKIAQSVKKELLALTPQNYAGK